MVDVFELWRVICRKLPILTYRTGLSCGVVCVFLRLAVPVEHRLVTDRHTTTAYTALTWRRMAKMSLKMVMHV